MYVFLRMWLLSWGVMFGQDSGVLDAWDCRQGHIHADVRVSTSSRKEYRERLIHLQVGGSTDVQSASSLKDANTDCLLLQ
jgi:hypothetical protein